MCVKMQLTEIGTTNIGIHGFEHYAGRKVFLLDTPGFDDTNRTDGEVLREIAYFLGASYSKNIKLAGIIYLHPITDHKMRGSAIKNLAMFQALCGDSSLEHVVLATTKWDDLLPTDRDTVGQRREKEVAESPDFWGNMLDNGSKMFRHYNNRASALRIIDHLLSRKGHMVLDIQRQMVDQGRSLDDTSAGQTLQRELVEQRRLHEAELHRIREGLDEAIRSGNQKLTKTMQEPERGTAAKLRQSEEEIDRFRTDYLKLQQEGEARAKEAIDGLNEELREYKVLADEKQAALDRIQAGMDKEHKERKADRYKWEQVPSTIRSSTPRTAPSKALQHFLPSPTLTSLTGRTSQFGKANPSQPTHLAGQNRFRPPQKRETWTTTLLTNAFGDVCPGQNSFGAKTTKRKRQMDSGGMTGDNTTTSEDCMNLNIWTSASPRTRNSQS